MPVPTWWQDAVAYQIYPRSFADANGDGIGDIPGMIDKLDYLQWLGVTVLWISPFYPSPLFDVGYDISDYVAIDPDYGTLEDFDRLLDQAHQRGIRILLDLVLNHTSDQHEWFIQSRSSRANSKRDWYIWRDGKNGGPPNNWESIFGGPAWTLDATTGQYYYHMFFPEQPDLNWRNPEVVAAMFDAVRYWLDRGVDGFRLDALASLFEDEDLTDAPTDVSMTDLMIEYYLNKRPPNQQQALQQKFQYQRDLPETYEIMAQLRQLCDEYPDRVLLGETKETTYYGSGDDMLHSVFNFDLTNIGTLDPAAIRDLLLTRWPELPPGVWESNTLGNHDRTRSMELFGANDQQKMQVALALTMFLWGTPTFYNGEEIGMRSLEMPTVEAFRDNRGPAAYQVLLGLGVAAEGALRQANEISRDKCRTPMQWANAPNAGFCPPGVQSWLPINPDYASGINVEDQRRDASSLLNFFRRLALLRRDQVALRRGNFRLLNDTDPVFAFWRDTVLVALNMSGAPVTVQIDGAQHLRPIFSSVSIPASVSGGGRLTLAPYEVFVGGQN